MAINYPAGGAKNLTSQMSLCIRPTLRQDSLQDSAAGSVCVSFCASVVMCFRVLSMWNLRCICVQVDFVYQHVFVTMYTVYVYVFCVYLCHMSSNRYACCLSSDLSQSLHCSVMDILSYMYIFHTADAQIHPFDKFVVAVRVLALMDHCL